jgi:WD40 repeat protein
MGIYLKSITYSPNGSRIASSFTDEMVILIWDVQTGDVVSRFFLDEYTTSNIMYSPDGTQVVSGCRKSYMSGPIIKFLDAETGNVMGKPLTGHNGPIDHITFSSDGSRLISRSYDNTIRIWDAKTAPFYNPNERLTTDLDVEIDNEGWIFQEGRRLLWVPEDCRSGLESAALLTIPVTQHHRKIRLDISQMYHGPSWTDIFVASSAKQSD